MKKLPHLKLATGGQNVFEGESDDNLILPYLATAGDLREAVQFLKRKPDGARLAEAMDSVRKRLFDPRKVFAYEFWGIVVREDDRLSLTPLGWEFAERLTPEADAYRRVLTGTPQYDLALKSIYERRREVVTHLDMGTIWSQNSETPNTENEERLEAYASSFFHLCQAADIGMHTVGRKGQPTRLRIYPEELENYIHQAAHSTARDSDVPRFHSSRSTWRQQSLRSSDTPRVLVSFAQESKSVDRILNMLDLIGLPYEVIARTYTENLPVAQQSFQAMHQCNVGIFVFDEGDSDQTGEIRNRFLMEVSAAFVHFDRRVVLLGKKNQAIPIMLQELRHYEYETDHLSWEAAVEVAKVIRDFIQ